MTQNRLYPLLVNLGDDALRRLDDHPVGGRLVRGTMLQPDYVNYLVQVVHQVRGSGTFLRRAGETLERQGRHRLAALFSTKSGEEEGHHLWALDDAGVLGTSPERVERALPTPAVQAYNAWARYAAESAPLAVLGLAFMLEWFGYCRAGQAARNLVAHSGIPRIADAVHFLREHGEADPGHIETLGAALDDVTQPEEMELVLMSARLTGTLYLGFFEPPPLA